MKKLFPVIAAVGMLTFSGVSAKTVTVEMNTTSPTMSIINNDSGEKVETGVPTARKYTFDVNPGKYELTAFATDGKTVNGTIELNVTEDDEQEFKVFTCTAYATNKRSDNTVWQPGEDYTLDIDISTREGERIKSVPGVSSTNGRLTFLALNGNSYYAALIPTAEHKEEGYIALYKSGTLTFGVTVSGAIPMGADYTFSLPPEAELAVGVKFNHFTEFSYQEATNTVTEGNVKKVTYRLASGQVYNYRTWMEDGLTQAGYFTMNTDASKCPVISFSPDSYKAFGPTQINHSVQSNLGYETGDIFVNINPQGYLRMNVGDTFDAHAMRSWELTDNSTNNYFMEPDFHYYVTDLDGRPSTGVITIDNSSTTCSPWSTIRAIGKGTVIVRVVYDAIGVNYYNGVNKTPYLGGEYWGAIWPENTAAFIVSVGETESKVIPNMVINENYNAGMLKLSGENIDAEHDVLYYLYGESDAKYTFRPENVTSVSVAVPHIGERTATYSGFSTANVTVTDDGLYTLHLPEGRNIVALQDADGNSTYQVITVKECNLEIENNSRPGSKIFQPGDKINLHFSGLCHPAGKLASIYNMSAYVTYNNIPNGTSLILSPNQYNFASSASAQTVTIDIPADYNVGSQPEIRLTDGVIQVNGYGDPIGCHRNISHGTGRSPNFTAVAHKTYFGRLPEVTIPISTRKDFKIELKGIMKDSEYRISINGQELAPEEDGLYSGTYGNYQVTVATPGYRCYRHIFNITDDAEGLQVFECELQESPVDAWDGITYTEPDMEGDTYIINTGNELAWFANYVNSGNITSSAILGSDIDLADYPWTPIGGSSLAKAFKGSFDGDNHTVSGVYISNSNATYQGFFGYVAECSISNLTVGGEVSAKQNTGGITAYLGANSGIDRCVNNVNVSATGNYVGGLAGNSLATATVTNCINNAGISGKKYVAGLIGYAQAKVANCYSIGNIYGDGVGAALNGTATVVKEENIDNVFYIKEYAFTSGQTLVTEEQMASGEIAYMLGDAFGQMIGFEPYPVLGGHKVYKLADGSYSNLTTEVTEINAEGEPYTVEKDSEEQPYAVFGSDGIRKYTLGKGLNIIVYSNGEVKKIFVR